MNGLFNKNCGYYIDPGEFAYKSVKGKLFFGYDHKVFGNDLAVLFAFAEKAIIDLLYLYPFYGTEDEMKYLRFDRDVLDDALDMERLMQLSLPELQLECESWLETQLCSVFPM